MGKNCVHAKRHPKNLWNSHAIFAFSERKRFDNEIMGKFLGRKATLISARPKINVK